MYTIDLTTGCWNWNGSISGNGYGVARINQTSKTAHRFIYEQEIGHIPDGLELDHTCRNRSCVNPKHLEPVTHSENMIRSMPFTPRVFTGLCKEGHELDGIRSRPEGGRYCKTCVCISKQRQRASV